MLLFTWLLLCYLGCFVHQEFNPICWAALTKDPTGIKSLQAASEDDLYAIQMCFDRVEFDQKVINY